MPTPSANQRILGFRKDIDFASEALLGAREAQEDYSYFQVGLSDGGLLAVLADGMGGHTSGEVASAAAVGAFSSIFDASSAESVSAKLGAALNQANNVLAERVKADPSLDGMGCTLVAACINSDGLHWISVGDSLLFLYRNNRIKRWNADHSMMPVIQEALRNGKITSEEAASHPNRNALRSALTGESIDIIDAPTKPVPLYKGDIVILASDGLLSLSEAEITAAINRSLGATAGHITKKLLAAVEDKKRPRQDNTTVQVIVIPDTLGIPPTLSLGFWWMIVLIVLAIAMGGLSYRFPEVIKIFQPLWDVVSEQPPASEPQPVPVPRQEALTEKSDGNSHSTSESAVKTDPGVGDSTKKEPLASNKGRPQLSPPVNPRATAPGEKGKDGREIDPQRDTKAELIIVPGPIVYYGNSNPPKDNLDPKSTNASPEVSLKPEESKKSDSKGPAKWH